MLLEISVMGIPSIDIPRANIEQKKLDKEKTETEIDVIM